MRFSLAVLSVVFIVSACGKAKDTENTKDVNAEAQKAFLSNWANKDVVTGNKDEKPSHCARLTTLPGTCTYVGAATTKVETNTCDIEVADSAINVAIKCRGAIGAPGCHSEDQTLEQVNSTKALIGSETSITGTGGQLWTVGVGLCDELFAAADSGS